MRAHAWFYFVLAFGLVQTSAWAATYPQKAGPYGPGVTVNDYGAHNARRMVPVELRTASPVVRYSPVTVGAAAGSVARMAKKAMGGPYGIAIAAAVAAYGYYVDEDTGELMQEGTEPPTSGQVWYMTPGALGSSQPLGAYGTTTVNACLAGWGQGYTGSPFSYVDSQNRCRSESGFAIGLWLVTAPSTYDPNAHAWHENDASPATPAPDVAVANAVEQAGMTPQVLNYYFTSNEFNLDRNRPVQDQVWPELVALADAVQAAVTAQHNGDPLTSEQQALLQRASETPGVEVSTETQVTVNVNVEAEPRTCDPALGDLCAEMPTPEPPNFDYVDDLIGEMHNLPGGPLPVGLEEPGSYMAIPDMLSGAGAACQPFCNDLFCLDLCPHWPMANTILSWIVALMTFLGLIHIWVDTMTRGAA